MGSLTTISGLITSVHPLPHICFRCFADLLLFQICEKESLGGNGRSGSSLSELIESRGSPTAPAPSTAPPWPPLWSTDSPSSATSLSGSRGTTSSSTMHSSNFTTRRQL